MSLKNPMIGQLYELDEEEVNRWKALFDDKFSKKDIRMILLIYFYLKLSGLYDHETNIFIISIQKFLSVKKHMGTDDVEVDGHEDIAQIKEFYKSCEDITEPELEEPVSSTSKIKHKKETLNKSTALFIEETLHDNIKIIEHILDSIEQLSVVTSKEDTNIKIDCIFRHNIVESNQRKHSLEKIIKGCKHILEEGKQFIHDILQLDSKNIVKTFTLHRDEYTSTTKDFIQDVLLSTTHEELLVDTFLNIVRHSIYCFLFDFELITYSNVFEKQVSLQKRIRSMLTIIKSIFTIMPYTVMLECIQTETNQSSIISLLVEDILHMTYYKSFSNNKSNYTESFVEGLRSVSDTTITELFYTLYGNMFDTILSCVEYKSTQYETGVIPLQTNYVSIQSVESELQTYLCSLTPLELFKPIMVEQKHTDTFATLFEKENITDSILSEPTIIVCKCNLSSEHVILLEEVLYFSLGFCDQIDSGVVHYLGEINDETIEENIDDTEELHNIVSSKEDTEDYIHVQVPSSSTLSFDIESSYIFYVECSNIKDIERMKQQLQSKPNRIQQLSTDIRSFTIY